MAPSHVTGQNQATVSPLHLKGTITDSKCNLAGMSDPNYWVDNT